MTTVETATRLPERGWLTRDRVWTVARVVLGAALLAFFVHQTVTKGLPLERFRMLAWIAAALAISCLGRPPRRAGQLVFDWVPFVALLLVYDYSRGLAENLGMPLQVEAQLNVEKALFLGHEPTVWLQERLLPSGLATPVRPWELALTLVYSSHFVVPYVVAGVLWARDRTAWKRYVTAFFAVSLAGVITFCLLPSAPPWMAAERGLIDPVDRVVGRGWQVVDLQVAGRLFYEGRAALNPVAAVPSLHAAFALLVSVALWPHLRHPLLRALLVAYPLAMAFVLVYGAEHYVVDVLLGWAYVTAAVVVYDRVARRRVPPDSPGS